ncbi:MAG: AgmX/PglI C-terminal domain-containing protein [Deltaproteobacteria bacterium]|nr:AgmX/PglI C-terminal domain-containing protein [Deltaproteobacteria bacterium]
MTGTRHVGDRILVALYWGETPLDVVQVKEKTGVIQAGSTNSCQIPLPPTLLPGEDFELLKIDSAGVTIRTPGDVEVEREFEPGRWLSMTTLPDPEQAGIVNVELPPNSRLRLVLGRMCLVLKRIRVNPVRRRALLGQLDLAFFNSLMLVFFVAAAFVATILLGPAAQGSVDSQLSKVPSRYIYNLVSRVRHERKLFTAEMMKTELNSSARSLADLPKGPAGKAGRRGIPDTGKRSARRAKKPDDREMLSRLGMVAALGDGPGLPGTYNTDRPGLGGDLTDALGGLHGKEPGDSGGYGGLDLVGTGPGGRGTNGGPIRMAGPVVRQSDLERSAPKVNYTKPTEKTFEITHGVLKSRGSLPADVIRAYIKKHRQQIKYCYERELTRYPDLTGKLRIHFIIAKNGGVRFSEADLVKGIGHTNLSRCILTRVKTWRFPKPQGGGEVEVRYPFLFNPSGKH